jgi:hypothetical protein
MNLKRIVPVERNQASAGVVAVTTRPGPGAPPEPAEIVPIREGAGQ